MEFNIQLIRDMMAVIRKDNAIVHVIENNVLVSHKYCGHDIVAWFKGDGMVHIYKSEFVNLDDLRRQKHVFFDTHSCIGKTHEAYRNKLEEFVSE